MNKRHGMIAVALVALLLITGCSTFFTGGVSGKVKCNGEPVARATVALYFDEGQRNADLAAKNKVFHTEYKTETQENGSFAITNIPWDSAFPEYGKDADSKTAYALVYHKDYGYLPIDGITIISGRSNEFFPEFKDELTKTETVDIKFMNPETKKLETGIRDIKISYEGRPGYNNAYEATVPVNNGIATFDIVYQGDSIPKFDIIDINYITYDEERTYTSVIDKEVGVDLKDNKLYSLNTTRKITGNEVDANNVVIINAIPLIHEFAGFHGSVETAPSSREFLNIYAATDIIDDIDDPKKMNDKKPIHHVRTQKPDDRASVYTDFRGLGSNIVLENKAVPTTADPGITGYPAVIENEYIINIKGTTGLNKVTASSDSRTWMDVAVSDKAKLNPTT